MHENVAAPKSSKEDEAIAAVEELIAELGIKCVVSAVLSSSVGSVLPNRNHAGSMMMINWILARIIDSRDPRLEADIMAIGSGLLLRQGKSMTYVAEKYGVTRADISKRVIEFCDEMGLPPSHSMRSVADRETYALTNKGRL